MVLLLIFFSLACALLDLIQTALTDTVEISCHRQIDDHFVQTAPDNLDSEAGTEIEYKSHGRNRTWDTDSMPLYARAAPRV
jgi:hypothetical protein